MTAAALLAMMVFRWRPPGVLTVYSVAILGLAVASSAVGARPRFVLTAFPLIIALAREVRGVAFTSLVGLSAMLLSIVTFIVVLTIYLTP
jgi:hypothetical protein